jgi:queuosine precursor transporter
MNILSNELIFLFHSITMSLIALIALHHGKEALTAFVAISCILANIFVIKQITIFGMSATPTDAFMIGAIMGTNLLGEYFGRKAAKKALWISFAAAGFFCLLAQLHLLYTPNIYDTSTIHFQAILHNTPRIIIASLISYFLSQSIEYRLYALLKRYFHGNYIAARNFGTMAFSQLFDTIIFSFLGLYGIIHNVTHIIVISYSIKLIAILLVAPFIMLSKKIYRNNHG